MNYLKAPGSGSSPQSGAGRGAALLGLLVLAACAGYAALVLYSASWPEAVEMRKLYDWTPRPGTAAEFTGLRRALLALATGAGLLALGLSRAPAGRAEWRQLSQEARAVGRGLGAGWRGLRPGQRRLAGGLLLALTALRTYYSLTLQAYDDATSYELFVRERLLAVSAAYPLPNNHLLSNTLSWLCYQVHPGFWWSMRLPVLLTSTAATVGWFLGLLRRSNFGVALGAVGWFCLPLESLYYAAVGRGYWLLVGLGAVGFFALLLLRERPASHPRLAALALVGSGVLGLYAVPTHLLLLAPAYAWWGLRALRTRDGRALAALLGLGWLTLAATALLYAPLLLLSGPQLLLHHRYMAPLAPAEFWGYVVANVRQPYQLLWLPLTLAALAGLLGLRRLAAAGRLPARLAGPVRQLGLASAWLMLAPYALAVAQRSYPPDRTLLYKAQYTFILLALVADWGLGRAAAANRRLVRGALGGATLAFAALQLWRVEKQEAMWRARFGRELARPGIAWLRRQPPGPVLAPSSVHRFLLHCYARPDFGGPGDQPWQLDARPRPGVRYRYLLAEPGERPVVGGRVVAGPPAANCHTFTVFVLP